MYHFVMYDNVVVSVFDGTRKVLPWTMWLCSKEYTFARLFEEVRASLSDDCKRQTTACTLAKATDSLQQITVETSFNGVACCILNGQNIRFALLPGENDSTSSKPQPNTFSVMMTSARNLWLPPNSYVHPSREGRPVLVR